jgi:hypothetical protein
MRLCDWESLYLRFLAKSVVVLCASISLAQQSPTSGRHLGARRPVTVADAVEMTKVGDDNYFRSDSYGNAAIFSPDVSKFAFVTQWTICNVMLSPMRYGSSIPPAP